MVPDWRAIVRSRFGAAIEMLDNAIAACPEHFWSDPSRTPQFWRVAYHTLFFLDLYASESVDGFAPPAPFTLDEFEEAPPERVYTKDELRGYLALAGERCRARIDLLADPASQRHGRFAWLDMSDAEVLLYNLRHVQHHAAQLNVLLRQTVDAAPAWVRHGGAEPSRM